MPWGQDGHGHWVGALGFGFGFEGLKVVVYGADGRSIPGEGGILWALAAGEVACEARGLAEGPLVGWSMLLHLLTRRFGVVPPALEARLAQLDAAAPPAIKEAALDAPSTEAFTRTLDDPTR